jgi:DNA-binding LacI/PurR family transcriptional regulator
MVDVANPAGSASLSRSRSEGAGRPATIYDVARLANVSHQTVSRFVKGYPGIRPETRDRVEAALLALNYRPNMAARSLATNLSHRIGALGYEMLELGPSKIIHGASQAAREAGYILDIVSLDLSDRKTVEEAIRFINQPDLAGVIAFASTDTVVAAFAEAQFSVPALIEAEGEDGVEHPSLNWRGLTLLVDHLVSLGHRRFAHIAGPADWVSARNRSHAYERALEAHGLRSVVNLEGDWSSASGYAEALRMPLDGMPTALVAGNDQMAFGAMRALRERGVRVPQDMSVVGFDDIPESLYFYPSLTTVRNDFDLQGRITFAKMLALIEGPDASAVPEPMNPVLFARESSAPPPA